MAIQFVGTEFQSSPSASVLFIDLQTGPLSSLVKSGDLMIVAISFPNTNAFATAPVGWTQFGARLQASGTAFITWLFWKILQNGDDTQWILGSPSEMVMAIAAFRNAAFMGAGSAASVSSSTTLPAATVNFNAVSKMWGVFLSILKQTSATTVTPPAGFTEPTTGESTNAATGLHAEIAYIDMDDTKGSTSSGTALGTVASWSASFFIAIAENIVGKRILSPAPSQMRG
jgi:hypothetical protein